MTVSADIRIMFAYSPRKNSAKDMLLYSTKKPATSSLSPSGRSKGARLVSASALMKKMMNIGNSGMTEPQPLPAPARYRSGSASRRKAER